MNRFSFAIIFAAACAAQPTSRVVDLSGARNDAFRAAAQHYQLSLDWLVALGYQQGRFEPADREDTTDAPVEDPADVLATDTPVDETDSTPDTIDAPDALVDPRGWGVMYLTDDQVTRAAALTGLDPDALRTDITANIDGAAALLADAGSDLRTATTAFLGVTDDAADLALQQIDEILADGFDLTTDDGERLALIGTAPASTTEIDQLAAGHYPATQWIYSPNFSSRLGSPIRYIAIHDIEGTMASAIQVFKNPAAQASAHYIVRSHDGHIVKMVHEYDNAWHVGHAWFNRHSIGIEHEGFANRKRGGGYYTDTLYGASAELSCAIAHRYHIPVDRKHIFGHYNVPSDLSSHTLCSDARGIAGDCGGFAHHTDPGRYWNWTKYMHLVAGCVTAAGG